jgi:hypothetical protein
MICGGKSSNFSRVGQLCVISVNPSEKADFYFCFIFTEMSGFI